MSEFMTQAPRRRPLGVTIIAVLDIVVGLIALLGGILGFLGLGLAGGRLPTVLDAIGGVLLGIAIIIGLVSLFVGWGLWTLRPWAYWTTVVLEIITIVDHLLGWLAHRLSTASLISDILIPVIIVVYLLADPNVREAFRT